MQIRVEPGKKSLHKPELVGQSTHNKSKLNKAKKTKGGAEGKSTAQTRCWWGKTRKAKNYRIKQNKHKHAGNELDGSRGSSTAQTRCLWGKTRKTKFWLKPQKRVTDFTGAEGKALHKPDVCEAKHAKQKLLNKAKLNTSVQHFYGTQGNSTAQSRCFWGKARKTKISIWLWISLDQFRFLKNCPPTPPPS